MCRHLDTVIDLPVFEHARELQGSVRFQGNEHRKQLIGARTCAGVAIFLGHGASVGQVVVGRAAQPTSGGPALHAHAGFGGAAA